MEGEFENMPSNATMVNMTTHNSTTPQGDQNCSIHTDAAEVFKIIGYVIIITLSLAGNTTIVALFARGRQQKTLDPFIISIAVSDLLIPLFAGIRELNGLVLQSYAWQVQGTTGDVLCKICSFMTEISPMISILSLCCITVYQYILVTFSITKHNAMQHTQHGERIVTCVVIGLIWLVVIAFNAHIFHTYKIYRIREKYYCDGPFFEKQETHRDYLMATFSIFFAFPCVLITFLNIFVAYKVRKQLKTSASSFPQWRRSLSKKQKRNQIMVVLMIFVFTVCWGPLGVTIWLYAFGMFRFPTDTCSYAAFHFVSLFMAYSNTAIYPWIYLFFFVFPERRRPARLARLSNLFASSMVRKRRIAPSNTIETKT